MFENNTEIYVSARNADRMEAAETRERGFSLIEVVISLVILLVAMLGVFQAFTYAIAYNAGNKTRGEALTVMQQEVELLRSKKFTPALTDPDLAGGTRTKTVTTASGSVFTIEDKVDNEPSVDGLQNEAYTCLTPQGTAIACAIKEVTITVTVEAPTPGWQYAVPAITVLRRTRGN
jgi:prepilin-type N-terminal cleavage/methylation domain-containing protein